MLNETKKIKSFKYTISICGVLFQKLNNEQTKITDRWNNIEPTINFTHELGNINTLEFFDILLINVNKELEFKVHRKSTNKNDYTHFKFHHNKT